MGLTVFYTPLLKACFPFRTASKRVHWKYWIGETVPSGDLETWSSNVFSYIVQRFLATGYGKGSWTNVLPAVPGWQTVWISNVFT